MKQKLIAKYIPKLLVDRAEKIAEELNKRDYFEYGFLVPPDANDVIRVAVGLGLRELEKQLGIELEKRIEVPPSTNNEEKNTPTDEKKQVPKDILGDFG